MKKIIIAIAVFVCWMLGQVFAMKSVNYYKDKIEDMIAERGSSSRLLFLKALDYYQNRVYDNDKKQLVQDLYDALMIEFDGCGLPNTYEEYDWYRELESALKDEGIDLVSSNLEFNRWTENLVNEICYSENTHMLILHIPLLDTGKKYETKRFNYEKEVYEEEIRKYRQSLNVWSYMIDSKKLQKNTYDEATIKVRWPPYEVKYEDMQPVVMLMRSDREQQYMDVWIHNISFEFWKRVGDEIEFRSGYGDAGCRSEVKYGYNIVSREVSVKETCRWCAEYDDKGNYISEETWCDRGRPPYVQNNEGEEFWKTIPDWILTAPREE